MADKLIEQLQERVAGLELAIAVFADLLHGQGIAKRRDITSKLRQAATAAAFRPEVGVALLTIADLIDALETVETGRPVLRLIDPADSSSA